ncbi:MAG TPA: M56 family metallopeptidase [Phenylobacterium sp.]|nr:M56 family metallopeptidase [Phenylobacterium sp.]
MSELNAFFGPDPAAALALAFLKANLVAGLAVAAVAVARIPARRLFGAVAAYDLWLAPPLAGFATLIAVFLPNDSEERAVSLAVNLPHLTLAAGVWALVAGGIAAGFALAQVRFVVAARRGHGGPAAVGFISPRIVLPADDGSYTAAERDLIRAHEREHVARKDPRAAAMAALAQCLCWFNPLVHLAAHLMRLDQELACDEAVVRRRPAARALYARTLLKTQLAGQPLPFGCYWPARGRHPLEVRIELLKARAETAPRASGGAPIVAPPIDAIRPRAGTASAASPVDRVVRRLSLPPVKAGETPCRKPSSSLSCRSSTRTTTCGTGG